MGFSPKISSTDSKNLENYWNQKLKDSGYKSIEGATDRKYNTFHKQVGSIDPKVAYYISRCWDLINSGKIKNRLNLFILERHAEGMSTRETALKLKRYKSLLALARSKSMSDRAVSKRLVRILKSNGLKYMGFKK